MVVYTLGFGKGMDADLKEENPRAVIALYLKES